LSWSQGTGNTGNLSGRTPMPIVGGINYNNNARALRWS